MNTSQDNIIHSTLPLPPTHFHFVHLNGAPPQCVPKLTPKNKPLQHIPNIIVPSRAATQHMVRTLTLILLFTFVTTIASAAAEKTFQAGTFAVDITPSELPVIVNGYFQERTSDQITDRLMSRALILDDGTTRLAIVIVDNLMIPRPLLDQAKQLAAAKTGIPTNRMLIAATHTHSAPSAMACLGSRADENYKQFLPTQIAKSIIFANEKLTPAKIGWTVIEDSQHNHCRRWIYRSDQIQTDPFDNQTVRAHMHPGHQSPKHIGPAGPADHDLSLLAVKSTDGRLLSILGNYAMHFFGAKALSADTCGMFGAEFAKPLDPGDIHPDYVGILSQGTSGDCHWMDYTKPTTSRIENYQTYTTELAKVAHSAYQNIVYHDWQPLQMAEQTLKLNRRTPDAARLSWAQETVAKLDGVLPTKLPDIYAHEQIDLYHQPKVEIKLQALSIGKLAITALPNEVYSITGLKLKAQSPFDTTFNIELANGAQGYIPPPEQHQLGGYTTWPAKTAGLEVQAEPKIVATLLTLLEKIAVKPRRQLKQSNNQYTQAIIKSKPVAFWQFEEIQDFTARDRMQNHHGTYESGTARFLPGPEGDGLTSPFRGNRAIHFAGGRMKANCPKLTDTYSVECWIWNGLPADTRPVTGYFFSRGPNNDPQAAGDHLGIGGTSTPESSAKLIFYNGNQAQQLLIGKTTLALKTWHHIVLVRQADQVKVYLNGNQTPEITGVADITFTNNTELFAGGRTDRFAPWEGKLDEISVYPRALTTQEITDHYKAAFTSSR